MAFFKLAVETGFAVEKIWEEVMEKVMFEKDIGVSRQGFFSCPEEYANTLRVTQDELLRKTVFGYQLRWARDQVKY